MLGPRARDRLLACSSSAASARSCGGGGRSARRSRSPVATSGKAVDVLGLRRRDRPVGPAPVPADGTRSIGIGGLARRRGSVFFALTFLPAVLGMLGPRVNALSLGGLRRDPSPPRPAHREQRRSAGARWERVAHAVMRRPIAVLIPVLCCSCSSAGTPFLRLSQGVPDASMLPPDSRAATPYRRAPEEFATGETTPIDDPGRRPGRPDEPGQRRATRAVRGRARRRRPASTGSRAPSCLRGPDRPARRCRPSRVAAFYAMPADQRRRRSSRLRDQLLRGLRPRRDRPPRRDQPARSGQPRRRRRRSRRSARSSPARASRRRSAAPRPPATTSSSPRADRARGPSAVTLIAQRRRSCSCSSARSSSRSRRW